MHNILSKSEKTRRQCCLSRPNLRWLGFPPEVAASDLIKILRSDTKWGVDDEVTVTLELKSHTHSLRVCTTVTRFVYVHRDWQNVGLYQKTAKRLKTRQVLSVIPQGP